MTINEGKNKINELINVPFKNYLSPEDYNNIIKNKGRTGQILELTIGLLLSNRTLDFVDGELKTNKCDHTGKPLETMFITQTASIIDDLLDVNPFRTSKLYKKLNHLLYVPISKDGSPDKWMYLPPIEVDLSNSKYAELAEQLEEDYYHICNEMNRQLSSSSTAMLHTVNGKFIQIRTKDSKPYTPIYSKKYGRIVSDKNRAFYFKKEFMHYIKALENK